MTEDEKKLKAMLDYAEYLGYKRGAVSVIQSLLEVAEKEHGTAISIKSIKDVYSELLKMP